MPRYSRNFLARRSEDTGFVRDTLEKVYRLVDILEYFNRNPLLRESVALKGGTAINLTIFNLPRLSVDIDLDYLKPVSRDAMLAERQRITADILKYMETQNYSLSPKAKRAHSLDSWVFRYINSAGNWDNIKIEINYSMRESVVLYSALASRTRDIEFGTSRIDELTNHRIRTDLLPVIRRKECFSLDEAKSRVKDFVSELMILTLREEEFVTCFRNEEYRPELLFEDATIVERIEQHPMALWKMRDTGGIDLGEPR
ncbi:MAG: nucleotidyl transferase AbiEii/AbiGii toxin family protein [Clostridia bacterium]|nr:nucleotidyl transferase AbiEii/AbiGii toxin family protein [Clostridia bacterium]